MLSSDEVLALDAILTVAIAKSAEEDDGGPVYHEVESALVNPFHDTHKQNVVYAGLSKLGMIDGSLLWDRTGKEVDFVCITPIGLQALKEAKGVH